MPFCVVVVFFSKINLVNFSLFVDSWRSRFLTGRQQWHSHYRGLLLGYRANTTTIKLYYQVSQLQVGLHLVRAVFARGGQCWGFGVSTTRAQTSYGYFFSTWLPGHLSNNWFVVGQNTYRRQKYARLRGGSQNYLSSNFVRTHRILPLEVVRQRVIYRLTSSLRVRLGCIRRTEFVNQVLRWSTSQQQKLSLRTSGKKVRSHRVQGVSKLNSSTRYVRKFLQQVLRRRKLNQTKLNLKVKLNFLTTSICQRLTSKYLLRARLLFNQGQTAAVGWWPLKVKIFSSRYLRFTFLYEGYRFFNFLYKIKPVTFFNHQLERLRYFYRKIKLRLKFKKKLLRNNLRLLARFYAFCGPSKIIRLHHNRKLRKKFKIRKFFKHSSRLTFFISRLPRLVGKRRRRRVRPFIPPPHLQPVFSIYLQRLKFEAYRRDSLRNARYRQKFGRPLYLTKTSKGHAVGSLKVRRRKKKRQFGSPARVLIRYLVTRHGGYQKKLRTFVVRRPLFSSVVLFQDKFQQPKNLEPLWVPQGLENAPRTRRAPQKKARRVRGRPSTVVLKLSSFQPRNSIQRFMTVFSYYKPHQVQSRLTHEALTVGRRLVGSLVRVDPFFYQPYFRYCSLFASVHRRTRKRRRLMVRAYLKEQQRLTLRRLALLNPVREKTPPPKKLPKKTRPIKKKRHRPVLRVTLLEGMTTRESAFLPRVLKLSSSSSRKVKRVLKFSPHQQDYYNFKNTLYGYSNLIRQRWRPQLGLFTARRARRAVWQKKQHFVFQPVTFFSNQYRWRPHRQTLNFNQGQLQLQFFPAVVVGGLLPGKLGSLASEVANLNLPFIYLYTTSVAPYVASYGVIWNSNGESRRGVAALVHHLYRYTTFGTLLQMFFRRLEL